MDNHMLVNVKALWDRTMWPHRNDHFLYSKLCEGFACEFLYRITRWSVRSFTEGVDARYDVLINKAGTDIKVEIKFQTNDKIEIEYARADHQESGIFVSESDFYLVFNKGYSRDRATNEWLTVGKMRLIPTDFLRRKVLEKIERQEFFVYEPSGWSPGSRVVRLDPREDLHLQDGYISDVDIVIQDDMLMYDLGPVPNTWLHPTIEKLYNCLYV